MSNELQTRDDQKKNIFNVIRQPGYITQLRAASPLDYDPLRLVRVAMTVLNTTPKVAECTERSILESFMICAETGLEPGPLGHAAIVPYNKKAQWQAMYKGLLHLCYRSELVVSTSCNAVREGDEFDWNEGSNPFVMHKRAPKGRGEIMYVYAQLHPEKGPPIQQVMNLEEVDAHRKRFSKDKRDDSAWITDFEAMALKTVLKRACKFAPVSVQAKVAITNDDLAQIGKPQVTAHPVDSISGPYCNQDVPNTDGLMCSLKPDHEGDCQP